MGQTSISVSLHDGIRCKTFAAEVTGKLGQPLKGVPVTITLDGDGSLSPDQLVALIAGETDSLGRVSISLNREAGQSGDIGAQLKAECALDPVDIHMLFLAMTPEHSRS